MVRACLRRQGWTWALLDFGPGLALQRHSGRLRQLLSRLLPTQAYGYSREDLHDDANKRFNLWFLFN
jgi:hypothetical protein